MIKFLSVTVFSYALICFGLQAQVDSNIPSKEPPRFSYSAPPCSGKKAMTWIEERLPKDKAYVKFEESAAVVGYNFLKITVADPPEQIPLIWLDFNGDGKCDFIAQDFIQGARQSWHYFMFFQQKKSGEFEMVYVSPGADGYVPDSIQIIYARNDPKAYLLLLRDTEIESCGSVVQWSDAKKNFVPIAKSANAEVIDFYKKAPQLPVPLFKGCPGELR